jgi:hypothetical protein
MSFAVTPTTMDTSNDIASKLACREEKATRECDEGE